MSATNTATTSADHTPAAAALASADQRRNPDHEWTVTEAQAEDLWRSGDRWRALVMLFKDGADPEWIANDFSVGLGVDAMTIGDLVNELVYFYGD